MASGNNSHKSLGFQRDISKLRKGTKERFAMMFKSMTESEAYKDLKPYSIKLYIAMLLWRKSYEETEIEYSYRLAENVLPKGTVQKAINDLIKHGFLEISRKGCFANRTATIYKLSSKWKDWKKVKNG